MDECWDNKNMIRNENIIDNLRVDKIEKIALGGLLMCRRSKQDVERRSDSVQTTTKKKKEGDQIKLD